LHYKHILKHLNAMTGRFPAHIFNIYSNSYYMCFQRTPKSVRLFSVSRSLESGTVVFIQDSVALCLDNVNIFDSLLAVITRRQE
jgi:hypothetical protein